MKTAKKAVGKIMFPNTLPINRELLRRAGNLVTYVDSGEICLHLTGIIIYSHMHYLKSQGDLFFDRPALLASELGICERKVEILIMHLEELDLIGLDERYTNTVHTWLASPEDVLARFERQALTLVVDNAVSDSENDGGAPCYGTREIVPDDDW